jgi:hypothetical protein
LASASSCQPLEDVLSRMSNKDEDAPVIRLVRQIITRPQGWRLAEILPSTSLSPDTSETTQSQPKAAPKPPPCDLHATSIGPSPNHRLIHHSSIILHHCACHIRA